MKIGIVGTNYYQGERQFFGTELNYARFVELFGEYEIVGPHTDLSHMKSMNAILLPGGPDVNPRRYGQKPSAWTYQPSTMLEEFDTQVLPKLIGEVPLIGICRGLQTLNVALGGTLYQHIHNHAYSQNDQDLVHEVRPTNGAKPFKVNSFHHQGIDSLSRDLSSLVVNEDGLVEAVSSKRLKIFAVQWHPERLQRDPFTESWIWSII